MHLGHGNLPWQLLASFDSEQTSLILQPRAQCCSVFDYSGVLFLLIIQSLLGPHEFI